jgi:hypothetical protein
MAVYRRRQYLANISSVISSPWINRQKTTANFLTQEFNVERQLLQFKVEDQLKLYYFKDVAKKKLNN